MNTIQYIVQEAQGRRYCREKRTGCEKKVMAALRTECLLPTLSVTTKKTHIRGVHQRTQPEAKINEEVGGFQPSQKN